MKQFFIAVFTLFAGVLFYSSPLWSQSLQVSYAPETVSFSSNQFPADLLRGADASRYIQVQDNEIIFAGGQAMISGFDYLAFSPNRSFIGVLFFYAERVSAEIYRSDGTLIHRIGHLADIHPNDPSRALFLFDNGQFVYRDNVAGFAFYNEQGENVSQVYNSFGSQDGEQVSQFSATAFGNSVYLYNPVIHEGGNINSRIQKAHMDESVREIAFFENRKISSLEIHPSGRMMLVHTIRQDTDVHEAFVLDMDGSILVYIDFENTEVLRSELSLCGRFITARASGRVMVYDVPTGERLGSASFRQTVRAAGYNPDGTMVVLTASQGSRNQLQNLMLHMIDIHQRTIHREDIDLSIAESPDKPLRILFDQSGHSRITGGNRDILIRY
ncbi:hypothetical protein QLX67_00160 [Balneolaceae bacterium ANBcel3]|nr:hypothetical protein [Balneolaceae bacterium ANBcel3]